MTRKELINQTAKETGLTKKVVDKVVRTLFHPETGTIINGIRENKEVKISGFGKFFIRKRKESVKVNPFGEKSYIIPSRDYLKFESSRTLRMKLR